MRKRKIEIGAAIALVVLLVFVAYGAGMTGRKVSAAPLVTPAPAVAAPAAVSRPQPVSAAAAPTAVPVAAPVAQDTSSAGLLAAYQGTLEQIYQRVDPSVVNIQVQEPVSQSNSQGFPFFGPSTQGPQVQQALGSGFVWDMQGHIITNNHVVDGATQIQVTFSDGMTAPAKLVGKDVNSDLAVIQVNVPASELHPVQMGDSSQLKVGQMAVAIGNPFGLQGSMTVGIISALGRSLPVGNGNTQGPTYSIPDIIQTDAPINPGNSGGVLMDVSGRVVGVTAAIESPVQASAGIGFAIPAAIVEKVAPVLIQTGHYNWPWFGVSGTDVTPDIATAMGLPASQRGALIGDVVAGSPAAKAGLQGSNKQVTIQGMTAQVGGDVIIAINHQPVKSFDDVVAYLADNVEVGQTVNLTVLRQGKEVTVKVTLAARPSSNTAAQQTASTGAWLGIQGVPLTAQIASAMNLSTNQSGILVQQVDQGSPAEQAGLQGSYKSVTINGQTMKVGGDVVVALDGQPIAGTQDLQSFLQQATPGQDVIVTLIRSGRQYRALVTLGDLPASSTT